MLSNPHSSAPNQLDSTTCNVQQLPIQKAIYKELVWEPCLDRRWQHKGKHEAIHLEQSGIASPVALVLSFLLRPSLYHVLLHPPALNPDANSLLQPPPSAGSRVQLQCLHLQFLVWPRRALNSLRLPGTSQGSSQQRSATSSINTQRGLGQCGPARRGQSP